MMTTISVTDKHIAEGEAAHCERCPVALAIAAACPDLAYIGVDAAEIIMQRGDDEAEVYADTPPEVAEFIRAFDNDQPVGPFTFTLDIGEPAVTP